MRTIVLALFACVLYTPLATRAQLTSHPDPDDINLYYGALRFVSAVHAQSLTAASPEEALTIQKSVCTELGITMADYQILIKEAASLSDASESMRRSSGKGWEARSSTGAQPPAQGATIAEKLVKADDVVRRVKQQLSAKGWANFHAFVNGKFRAATTITRTGK